MCRARHGGEVRRSSGRNHGQRRRTWFCRNHGDDVLWRETEQLSFLNFERGDELFEQRRALGGFGACADLEFVVFVRLIFRGFFTEQASDGFPKGELGSGADRFPVGKSVSTQIVDLNTQFPKGRDASCEFIHRVRFGFAAYCLGCFYSCHAKYPSREKSLSEGVLPDKQSLLLLVAYAEMWVEVMGVSRPTRPHPGRS